MLVCKKTKAYFFLSTLVLGLSASNISCSANPVSKGLIKQAQKKSFSNTKLKSNSEVKGTPNNFLNKIKILAKEKPEAILLPAGIFLAALFTAAFVYHVKKKSLQEPPNNSDAEEEKSTDVTQNFQPDYGKENDSGATKSVEENIDVNRKDEVTKDEETSIKGTPVDTDLEEKDSPKSHGSVINTNGGKSGSEETSPEKAFYNDIMYYTKIVKWWCFWSALLFSYCLTLSGILTVIFFPELFSFAILFNIFGFLAPFLTFCLDPILNILNIHCSLKAFLEIAIFSTFALIFTVVNLSYVLSFIIDNARLAMKGRKMLDPCSYILYSEAANIEYSYVKKAYPSTTFLHFIKNHITYKNLSDGHTNMLLETYKVLNDIKE